MRDEWILSQWRSSILKQNIGRVGDLISNLLFSSLQHYWLSYGAQLKTFGKGHYSIFLFFKQCIKTAINTIETFTKWYPLFYWLWERAVFQNNCGIGYVGNHNVLAFQKQISISLSLLLLSSANPFNLDKSKYFFHYESSNFLPPKQPSVVIEWHLNTLPPNPLTNKKC